MSPPGYAAWYCSAQVLPALATLPEHRKMPASLALHPDVLDSPDSGLLLDMEWERFRLREPARHGYHSALHLHTVVDTFPTVRARLQAAQVEEQAVEVVVWAE